MISHLFDSVLNPFCKLLSFTAMNFLPTLPTTTMYCCYPRGDRSHVTSQIWVRNEDVPTISLVWLSQVANELMVGRWSHMKTVVLCPPPSTISASQVMRPSDMLVMGSCRVS